MSRRKSTVFLRQPATSMLRRSARLISQKNRDSQGKPRKDVVSFSEPPKKSRREVLRELSKRLVYSLDSSIEDLSSKKSPGSNEFPSLRRSLRLSSKECSDANKDKPSSTKSLSTSSSSNVSSSCALRRSPRFLSGGGGSVDRSSSTKSISTASSSNVWSSCTLRRSPRFLSGGGGSVDRSSSSNAGKSGNCVLSRCSTKSISSKKGKGGDALKSRDASRSRVGPKTKQMFRGCDDDDDDEEEEEEVSVSERKKVKLAKPNEEDNTVPKADEGKRKEKEKEEEEEGLKTKKKLDKGWTEELELALQGAYLTVKPSPHFWKKVAKMVPGKSAQECFDRVNSALITPRQAQPRTRARKANLSTIPQFSLSASKLLKPNSPKMKIRQRRNNLSKKMVRHLLEKQNHMDQGLGFDLFSVLEPSSTSNFLSTPVEEGQSLPKILESPVQCTRSENKETTLVSPPVLKQVKNKALHEKYIDHLHIREAKRKAEFTRFAGKENIRPIDIQKKDSVRAAKDALLFDVQDAIQKLKGLEAENSPSTSEFCYDHGETDEEDE